MNLWCRAISDVHAHPPRQVVSQLPWVLAVQQRFSSPYLDALAHASANSVTVEFFITLLPAAYWLGYHNETLRLTLGLALTTYVNSGWKDYVGSPRPWFACCPLLQRSLRVAEDTGEVEYGAPSLHTAVSLFMNIYTTFLVWERSPDMPRHTLVAMYAASIAWTCWIAWTRVYLGVHSPVDLALGATLATALLAMWRPLAPALMGVLHSSPAITCSVGLGLLLLAFRTYPRPQKHTTSYIPTVIFTSAAYGLMAGHAAPPEWVASIASALPPTLLASLRSAPAQIQIPIGFVILVLYMAICKPLLVAVLPLLLGLAPPQLRRLWQPPISMVGPVVQSRETSGQSTLEPAAAAAQKVGADVSAQHSLQQLGKSGSVDWDGVATISLPVTANQGGKQAGLKEGVAAAAVTQETSRHKRVGSSSSSTLLDSQLLSPRRAGLRSATKARREAAASMDSSISGSSFLESEPDSNGSGSGVFTAAEQQRQPRIRTMHSLSRVKRGVRT
ncbi:MAG: hypothetical protein WDW38_009234 [Sanguina aurantia]